MSETNRTVTVACKLGNGLIIRDFVKVTRQEPVPNGGFRSYEVYEPRGRKYFLKGPAPAMTPVSRNRSIEIVGGYAITEGIPADVFERFAEANKDSPFFVNQLIYGHEDGDRVRAWARDNEKRRTGFEPLDVTMKSKRGQMFLADERIPIIRGSQIAVD